MIKTKFQMFTSSCSGNYLKWCLPCPLLVWSTVYITLQYLALNKQQVNTYFTVETFQVLRTKSVFHTLHDCK